MNRSVALGARCLSLLSGLHVTPALAFQFKDGGNRLAGQFSQMCAPIVHAHPFSMGRSLGRLVCALPVRHAFAGARINAASDWPLRRWLWR
jgi:hypothetical protein